ncbi:Uncharacterised protein [Streptococcus pneumoniae]|nr:Uncharacterised protein [Streptococcus pneumoniae]
MGGLGQVRVELGERQGDQPDRDPAAEQVRGQRDAPQPQQLEPGAPAVDDGHDRVEEPLGEQLGVRQEQGDEPH